MPMCHSATEKKNAHYLTLCKAPILNKYYLIITPHFKFLLPVTVQTEPIYHTAGTEGKRVTGFIYYSNKGIGSRYSCQLIFRTVAAMHKICQITLGKSNTCQTCGREHVSWWAEMLLPPSMYLLSHNLKQISQCKASLQCPIMSTVWLSLLG